MMTPMPRLPKMVTQRECACGCKGLTKSTWVSGHDGRATGWARRVHAGAMKIEDVPANERKGAVIMLQRMRAAETSEGVEKAG